MNRYWENGSGYYDPTAKEVIQRDEERDRIVRDTIIEAKQLMEVRNLKITNRMVVKDNKTGKIYK